MKNLFFAIASSALLFSCNPSGSKGTQNSWEADMKKTVVFN